MSLSSSPCEHCGLPTPVSVRPATGVFCCHGCRAAHELLHAAGLEQYYALRDRLDPTAVARPVASTDDGAYAHFDDPQFLASHGLSSGCAELRTDGVQCAACVWVIEQLPRALEGVTAARVQLGTGRVHLRWDPDRTSLGRIATFLHGLGYPTRAVDAGAQAKAQGRRRTEILRLAVAGAVAGNVMMLASSLYGGGFVYGDGPHRLLFQWVSLALTIPSVTWAAAPFHRRAWAGLRMGVLHMDLPIAMGLLAGFAASVLATVRGSGEVYFDSVAVLVFLLLLGRHLQRQGQDAALSRAELLPLLTPPTASLLDGGRWRSAPARTLVPGDVVRVVQGERFPADGRVHEGRGHADLGWLTGESRPVALLPGSPVVAGSTNVGPPLQVRVEHAGVETRIGRLVGAIESADAARAPIVHLADRVSGWFVAAVLGLAVIGGAGWWVVDPSRVFDVVVSLLVVSCPCALGLATPMALAVARGQAVRTGILVKSTQSLELAARADQVYLDKTGTLTEGRLRVVHARFAAGSVARRIPELVGAIEASSDHPIARALRCWALEGARTPVDPAHAVTETAGRGIEGRVGSVEVRIGSPSWLGAGELEPAVRTEVGLGHTPVVVQVDGCPLAVLGLGDRIKADASDGVRRLRALGLRLAIRSGDHPAVVAHVARQLGISDARGGMTPEDKAAAARAEPNATMVGDGINDAAALREATVGIAVGGGAEAALHVADVYLTRPGVGDVARFFEGARRTLRVVRRNLWFSALYNVCFASLALAGHITPLLAAILMPASSLTVVLSSVLARPFRPSTEGPDDLQKMPRPAYPADGIMG